jgi:hypothetical protein
MAPAQSYLDVHGLNPDGSIARMAQGHFLLGQNVYAYLLKRYWDWIDMVSIHFFESYSRATLSVYGKSVAPSAYLASFVQKLASSGGRSYVDVEQDPDIGMQGDNVTLPLSKAVLGFTNEWVDNGDEKTLFVHGTPLVLKSAPSERLHVFRN